MFKFCNTNKSSLLNFAVKVFAILIQLVSLVIQARL